MPDTDNTHSDAELRKKLKAIEQREIVSRAIDGSEVHKVISLTDEAIEEILVLFQAETDRLLHEVIEQLPEVSAAQDNEFSNGYTLGFQAATDQVVAVLNTYLRGGNHDDSA